MNEPTAFSVGEVVALSTSSWLYSGPVVFVPTKIVGPFTHKEIKLVSLNEWLVVCSGSGSDDRLTVKTLDGNYKRLIYIDQLRKLSALEQLAAISAQEGVTD